MSAPSCRGELAEDPVDPSRAAGRTPPSNLQAEASLLGAMLLSRDAIADAIEIVSAEHFYKPAHAHIFEAILTLYSAGEPADPVTVAEELARAGLLEAIGGPGVLVDLQATTPAISSAAKYARIVHDCALLRRLIGVAHEIAEIGYSRPDDVVKAIDTAESLMYEVGQGRVSDTMAQIRDLLDENLDRLEQLYERGQTITGTPSGYVDLDEMLSGLQPSSLVVVGARPAMGKALALDTPIPTPSGWTTMGALRLGDTVFDERGVSCRVTYLSPVRDDRQCYRVVFDDGSELIADAEHQWCTYDDAAWQALQVRCDVDAPHDQPAAASAPAVRTTAELLATLRTADGRPNHRIPVTRPLELPNRALPLEPYVLGVWLGCGVDDDAVLATTDPHVLAELDALGYSCRPNLDRGQTRLCAAALDVDEALEQVRTLVRIGWCTRHAATRCGLDADVVLASAIADGWVRHCTSRICRFAINAPAVQQPADVVASHLRHLCVLGHRHVPVEYLRASVKQRLALLQGLMDTAGEVSEGDGSVAIRLRDRELVEQVRELVCSLGHHPGPIQHHRGPAGDTWYFRWVAPEPVFRRASLLERQAIAEHPTAPNQWRCIVEISPVPSVPVRCITVDSPSHLYLAGRSMVPTHNTAFALGMAAHAAIDARRPVMLFSLEMSQLELSQRLLCAESRVDSKNVRDGRLTEADWKKISHGVGRLAEAPIWIDDNPNTTVMEIRAKARRLKSRIGDLGLIIVDYLQLMTGRSNAENRQVEVSEISRGLKILARELEVPVVALSQLSRTLESRQDKRPMLADLRESGSIEQDADVVMFIYRDEVYHPDTSDLGTAEIIVAKHRNGPTGVVRLAFLPHYTRFANMARNV
ncbi:MAG TPA: replicative DNA helicase [Acidimicrobiales bacterium]